MRASQHRAEQGAGPCRQRRLGPQVGERDKGSLTQPLRLLLDPAGQADGAAPQPPFDEVHPGT